MVRRDLLNALNLCDVMMDTSGFINFLYMFCTPDGGIYNTEECNYDDEDCLECNALVPVPTKIGK